MSKMTHEEAFDVVTSLIMGGDINSWQVEALQYILNENTRLRKSLRWALSELPDKWDDQGTPDHSCGYIHGPDPAVCDFHEKYWTARELVFPEEFDGSNEQDE